MSNLNQKTMSNNFRIPRSYFLSHRLRLASNPEFDSEAFAEIRLYLEDIYAKMGADNAPGFLCVLKEACLLVDEANDITREVKNLNCNNDCDAALKFEIELIWDIYRDSEDVLVIRLMKIPGESGDLNPLTLSRESVTVPVNNTVNNSTITKRKKSNLPFPAYLDELPGAYGGLHCNPLGLLPEERTEAVAYWTLGKFIDRLQIMRQIHSGERCLEGGLDPWSDECY